MNYKYLFRYALAGALFGLIFPIVSTIVQTLQFGLTLTLENLAYVQAENQLLWVIDTAPFFLGAFAGLAGIRQDRLDQQNTKLETEILVRKQAFEELKKLKNIHDQEVKERTLILEREVLQSKASAQVTQAVSSILNPDELIEQVVAMIQKTFGLYYVGVFVVDERKEWAILRAGTGTAENMLARGHRIKIGEGIIGWSIANAKARVALEVEDDNKRLATAELPETRSELAVPLRSRGQVLGAFTVQDSQPNAFDEQSIVVLQQMADQVAIALDNARLFAESQKALEASRQVSDKFSQEAWNQYLSATSDIDFLATPQSETQIRDDVWQPEMAETFRVGDITQHGEKTIHIPIILRNQTLGVVRLRKRDETGSWSQEEIDLMDTLVDRLETALETARLYSDTQRQAARVSLTQDVTDKLHRSLNMDNLMQTLLQEVSNALGASDAFIQLSTPTQTSDSASHQGISTN